MATEPQRPNRGDVVLSSLNAAVEALNLAKEFSSIAPVKAVFDSAGVLLVIIKVGSLLVPIDHPLANVVYRTQ